MGMNDDYDVYNGDTGEYIGSVELPEDATTDQMPDFLEINGVSYRAEK